MQYNLLWICSEIQLPHFVRVRFAFCVSAWKYTQISPNSSVGRASDWRSESPWFNPGFRRHVHFLSSWNIFFIQAFTRTCWSRDQKKPTLLTHFYISILKNYSIFFDANDDTLKKSQISRNSSVGRASDWRSECPWFNPGFSFILQKFFFQALQELVGQQSEKNQHFWRTFILLFWKTIRFPLLQTMIHHINNAFFFVPYGKFSLFNFD